MDKKQFKEFIESVAEIKELKPTKTPNLRLDNDAEDVCRSGDEWLEITAQNNPTLGFKFLKLKDKQALCQLGCGDVVSNQIIEKRLCETPKRHWRTKCNSCGCFVSPDGVGFIEGGHAIQAAYMRHFNIEKNPNKKLEPVDIKFKGEDARQITGYDKDGREYIEIVTNNNVIRKYV